MTCPNYESYNCFTDSLAKLLEVMGDNSSSEIILSQRSNCQTIFPDGKVHPDLTTRIIEDLTEGKYTAKVIMRSFGTINDGIELFGYATPEILKITEIEENAGRIIYCSELPSTWQTPSILFILKGYDPHALVDLGNSNRQSPSNSRNVIDNGEEKELTHLSRFDLRDKNNLDYRITGILNLSKRE